MLTIEQIKKHLNIDEYFHDDDDYLLSLQEVAKMAVERHIDLSFDDIKENNGGEIPPPLLHALLLLIGNLYRDRESVSFVNATEIPLTYNYILSMFKNYNG